MARSKEKQRAQEALARKRLLSVIGRHTVATIRTLEQKISDAGPFNQRLDPHILNDVRKILREEGQIDGFGRSNASWLFLTGTPRPILEERLNEQLPIWRALQEGKRLVRIGQSLEIAIYRALLRQNTLEHMGGFADLENHGDDSPYSKIEPPGLLSGRHLPKQQKLDFLVRHPKAGWAGIEAKNTREWLYPNHKNTRDLIRKSVALDCIPVLIVRRFQYSLFSILSPCGLMLHQNYNQLLPEADRTLADQAKNKRLLGYHDVRVGNQPDSRLIKFITTDLPQGLPKARKRFDKNKDLLEAFVTDRIDLEELTAQVRQRTKNTPTR